MSGPRLNRKEINELFDPTLRECLAASKDI